jgi:flagellar hook-associated protein 2
MISVPGIGSGLDINAIVAGLVAAEGDAKTLLLANKRSDTESEISVFGSLKSIASTFLSSATILKTASTFEANAVTSADTTVYTATTSGSVVAGVYGVEVRDFAEAQKLMTTGFTNQDTVVGTGTLTITVGASSFNVTIDSNNNTLSGIRSAINDATDNTGVSATIANVDDGAGGTVAKLILSSNNTGIASALTITVNDDDLNDTDATGLSAFYYNTGDATSPEQLIQINAAVDAEIYIEGQKVLSSSNTVVDAIQGVTLTLLKEDAGKVYDLTIATDTASIKSNIELFVSNYNSVISFIKNITAFDADAGTVGILLGDATVRSLSNQVRTQINQTVTGISGSFNTLIDLGITSKSDGSLEIDDTKLSNALSTNLSDVADLFSSANGVATRLESTMAQYTQSDGIIDSKTSGLNETVNDINDDLENLQLTLTALEERLFARFSVLDILVTQLNTTSSFLTQQFDAISNINNRAN